MQVSVHDPGSQQIVERKTLTKASHGGDVGGRAKFVRDVKNSFLNVDGFFTSLTFISIFRLGYTKE